MSDDIQENYYKAYEGHAKGYNDAWEAGWKAGERKWKRILCAILILAFGLHVVNALVFLSWL